MARPVILLRREGGGWQAEPPSQHHPWWLPRHRRSSDVGPIHQVVADARKRVGEPVASTLKVKVAEGTCLERDDVLALIEANGGSDGLDLCECEFRYLDLSRDTILQERHHRGLERE